MTKQGEIDALNRFIESLPRESYLRPWLEEIRVQAEEDIRNDFCIAPSITATKAQCWTLLERSQQQAADLIAAAKTKATQIEEAAAKEAAQTRETWGQWKQRQREALAEALARFERAMEA